MYDVSICICLNLHQESNLRKSPRASAPPRILPNNLQGLESQVQTKSFTVRKEKKLDSLPNKRAACEIHFFPFSAATFVLSLRKHASLSSCLGGMSLFWAIRDKCRVSTSHTSVYKSRFFFPFALLCAQ